MRSRKARWWWRTASDNAGGGAASDNTNIIRRLLERGVTDAAVGPVWDPVAVELCHAAGVGAKLTLRIGGKTAVSSGAPIDGEATVLGLCKDGRQTFGQAMVPFGDGAGIRIGGVDIALIAHRTQALGTEIFTASGIDLATKKVCRREVHQPLPRRLCADRRQGAVLRRRRPLADRHAQVSVQQGPPHHLAARRIAGGEGVIVPLFPIAGP